LVDLDPKWPNQFEGARFCVAMAARREISKRTTAHLALPRTAEMSCVEGAQLSQPLLVLQHFTLDIAKQHRRTGLPVLPALCPVLHSQAPLWTSNCRQCDLECAMECFFYVREKPVCLLLGAFFAYVGTCDRWQYNSSRAHRLLVACPCHTAKTPCRCS
jgi:hypothetical protein